ncbi:MAG: DUF1287 domain-containing protein [Olsenella sp.]|nr:DUF1287 domain-containing protein [Olsenella sp.]
MGAFLSRYQRTSAERPANQYDHAVPQLHSTVDRDGDGIDDQADILQGALAYVGTHPKYKSEYCEGGYPDDGYGVCTDVVAFALRSAGYDLRELVDADIREDPFAYGIETPDKDIDFRRVKNLQVFFRRNETSLSTDVHDIGSWQGGDIVVFSNHIGIVSDRRNRDGVPYVIHHNDPLQASYEQDILESRDGVVGHYRMSE